MFGFPPTFHATLSDFSVYLSISNSITGISTVQNWIPFSNEDFRLSMTSVISTTHHLLGLYILYVHLSYEFWPPTMHIQTFGKFCHILRLCARGFGYVSESDFPMNGSYCWIAKIVAEVQFPNILMEHLLRWWILTWLAVKSSSFRMLHDSNTSSLRWTFCSLQPPPILLDIISKHDMRWYG